MSRAIKFRVWDTKLQKMMSWNPFIRFDDSDYVVQQFTGLFDSAGKEIYERDIVKGSRNYWVNDDDFQDLAEVLEVKFGPLEYCKAPAFRFVMKDGCDLDFYGGPPSQGQMIVIGNIFENPELLK